MTIITPNKKGREGNVFLLVGIAFMVAMVILSVFFYNSNVELRYISEAMQEEISRLKGDNADMRDDLYSRLDFDNVSEVVNRLGLVKENSPEYLLAFGETSR
jgi:hypothetical protein